MRLCLACKRECSMGIIFLVCMIASLLVLSFGLMAYSKTATCSRPAQLNMTTKDLYMYCRYLEQNIGVNFSRMDGGEDAAAAVTGTREEGKTATLDRGGEGGYSIHV